MRRPHDSVPSGCGGFTLLELLLALTLGALVLAALIALVQGVTLSTRQQQSLADLQASARLALGELAAEVEGAGFTHTPWAAPAPAAVAGSTNGVADASDRLVLQRLTPINCVAATNEVSDSSGAPAHWLRRSEYEVRDGSRLVKTCHYGPVGGPATRQLNAATLVEGVEALQFLFGEDRNDDGTVDAWVPAGAWSDERKVRGLRAGLLLAGSRPVGAAALGPLPLLDRVETPADDGRPRLALVATLPIRGRQ